MPTGREFSFFVGVGGVDDCECRRDLRREGGLVALVFAMILFKIKGCDEIVTSVSLFFCVFECAFRSTYMRLPGG
jgi:hypothetical protein